MSFIDEIKNKAKQTAACAEESADRLIWAEGSKLGMFHCSTSRLTTFSFAIWIAGLCKKLHALRARHENKQKKERMKFRACGPSPAHALKSHAVPPKAAHGNFAMLLHSKKEKA